MGHSNCDKCGHDKRMCDCDRYVAQEGGDHYQAEYQHWDWVTDIGMGYLPGNATKYVSRWRKKNGEADLRKAMTYVDKMLAILKVEPGYRFNREASYKTRVCTDRFVEINGLVGAERSIMELLSGPCPKEMLVLAKEHIRALLQDAQRGQGRPSPAPAPTLPPTPGAAPAAPAGVACGGAAGATTQAPASSASTELATKPLSGRTEHPAPFGYEGDD